MIVKMIKGVSFMVYTPRENYLSLVRRKGYQTVPVDFPMCPSLWRKFTDQTGITDIVSRFNIQTRGVSDMKISIPKDDQFRPFFKESLEGDVTFDKWGVGHKKGSAAAAHMTHFIHPLAGYDCLEEIKAFPFLDYRKASGEHQKKEVDKIHDQGFTAVGEMACTIWENAWYIRSMEDLFFDMMEENEIAEFLFDKIAENACVRAASFAAAGVDILHTGDDIGMQHTTLMSPSLYRRWIKPRFKKVIAAAKAVNPDILIEYHSCGYIVDFVDDLIECGIDILNPVQPECMKFEDIHAKYGNILSFRGTIGTQTTMPFGSPDDVKKEVFKNLDIAGKKGGLIPAPTHLLEPEVPVENILAYLSACEEYIRSR